MNDAGEGAINYLTSSNADKDTDTPAYKEVSAKLEVLIEKGESLLPKINHRYGNPHSLRSVSVSSRSGHVRTTSSQAIL